MSFAYPLTALVTLASLIIYIWMGIVVGQARAKHNTPAPATVGPDEFMRAFRVQNNTVEALILFLPALWLFALTTQDLWAAVIGVFFPLGRLLYARGYYKAADKRGTGFLIGYISTMVLVLGALIAVVMQLAGF
ncbi:MAG: MAPEG family protein [Rhizobiales bacterium]|nr:MAPEG family protein [Hyphomicrobiales bacterium]